MNITSSLGLNSPTIEGRIILTAENRMGEGFDAARKQLDEFAKEASKVQVELNTYRRHAARVQKENIKDAEKTVSTVSSMFKNIAATVTSTFAVLTVTLDHFDDIFREHEINTRRRNQQIRAESKISVEMQRREVERIVKERHLPSRGQALDVYAELSTRTDSVAEANKRFKLIYDLAAKHGGQSPMDIQQQIQSAIRRPTQFQRLFTEFDPDYYKYNNRKRELRMLSSERFRKDPERAEAYFWSQIAKTEARNPELKDLYDKINKGQETYNDNLRELNAITEETAASLAPLNKARDEALRSIIKEFQSWPPEIRHAVELTGQFAKVMGEIIGLMVIFNGVMKLLAGPAAAVTVGAGAATAAGGAAAAGKGLLGGAMGSLLRLGGRALGAGASGMLGYEVLSGLDQMKGGDGSLRSVVRRFSGTDPDSIEAAPYGRETPTIYMDMTGKRYRDLRGLAHNDRRDKDDRVAQRNYTFPYQGVGPYDPRLPPGYVRPYPHPYTPPRQHGGIVRANLPYMVGEAGREMFVPNSDGSVAPLRSPEGGVGKRSTIQQFNRAMAEATSGVEDFTEALDFATDMMNGGGIDGGLDEGGGSGFGGGGGRRRSRRRGRGGGSFGSMTFGGIGSDRGAGGRAGEAGAAMGPVGPPGTYRNQYNLSDADLSDAVVNTIAGEARLGNQKGVDAVINNMMNRVGSGSYPGGDANLLQVARAPGQYAGYRRATAKQAEYIRSRMRAIASGSVPDPTMGSTEYRAAWYNGPWMRKHGASGVNVGGNMFAPWGPGGPYMPYKSPHMAELAAGSGGAVVMPHGIGGEAGRDAMRTGPGGSYHGGAGGGGSHGRGRGIIPLRDPVASLQAADTLRLGRGEVAVSLKLDRQLVASGPASVMHASNFDLGVNVDRTGHPFSRPGDPAFPPPPSYA